MKRFFHISLFFNLLCIIGITYALVKIGSPSYIFYLIKNKGQGVVSLKKHKTSHLKTLPIIEGRIIMLGNSITAECEWAELLENPNVLNRGVIGDGTTDILNRLDDVIALKPKKIFLLIGVNDLLYLPLSTITKNYEKIVNRLLLESPNTQLYLESVLPIHNSFRRNDMKNEDIDILNKNIEQIAQKRSLTYINLNEKFKSILVTASGELSSRDTKQTEEGLNPEYSIDGIHLNGKGYLLFKDIISPYINN